MQIIALTQSVLDRVKEVVEYASRPENVYRPGPGARIPGDVPEHVAILGDFRCVFSFTDVRDELYRHLSISIKTGTMPNPVLVQEIARLYGFTGTFEDWGLALDAANRLVTLGQKIETPAKEPEPWTKN